MPNLWIINQYANTPDMPGHTRQYEMATGLIKKGWNVNVISSDFNLSKRYFIKLKGLNLKKKENINVIDGHWLRLIP